MEIQYRSLNDNTIETITPELFNLQELKLL